MSILSKTFGFQGLQGNIPSVNPALQSGGTQQDRNEAAMQERPQDNRRPDAGPIDEGLAGNTSVDGKKVMNKALYFEKMAEADRLNIPRERATELIMSKGYTIEGMDEFNNKNAKRQAQQQASALNLGIEPDEYATMWQDVNEMQLTPQEKADTLYKGVQTRRADLKGENYVSPEDRQVIAQKLEDMPLWERAFVQPFKRANDFWFGNEEEQKAAEAEMDVAREGAGEKNSSVLDKLNTGFKVGSLESIDVRENLDNGDYHIAAAKMIPNAAIDIVNMGGDIINLAANPGESIKGVGNFVNMLGSYVDYGVRKMQDENALPNEAAENMIGLIEHLKSEFNEPEDYFEFLMENPGDVISMFATGGASGGLKGSATASKVNKFLKTANAADIAKLDDLVKLGKVDEIATLTKIDDVSTILKAEDLAKAQNASDLAGTLKATDMASMSKLGQMKHSAKQRATRKTQEAAGFGYEALASVLGKTTGTSKNTVMEAFRSGSTPEFKKALRGLVSESDIVNGLTQAFDGIKKQANVMYKGEYTKLQKETKKINVTDMVKKFSDNLDKNFGVTYTTSTNKSGRTIVDIDFSKSTIPDSQKSSQMNIKLALEDMLNQSDGLPASVDILKKRINNYVTNGQDPANRVADGIMKRLSSDIGNSITKQVPYYGEMQKKYAKSMDLMKDLEAIGGANAKNKKTAFNKFLKLMDDDADFAQNILVEVKNYSDSDIMAQLAGLKLQETLPKGLIGSLAIGGGIASTSIMSPYLLAGLATTSPRLVGEFASKLGTSTKTVNKAVKNAQQMLKPVNIPTPSKINLIRAQRVSELGNQE